MNNREFENILDQCLESLLIEGGTVEQCLESHPEQADELRPLLETFADGRQAAEIRPSDAFRSRARTAFQAELREMELRKSRSFFSFEWLRQPQWATAAIAIVLMLVTGGTALAASGSMPDQFLYPVKRATEQVQLAFTFTELGKAELNARLADNRGEEIIYLVSNAKYDEISAVTAALDSNLNNVAVLSAGGPAATVAMAPVARMEMAEESAPAAEQAEGESFALQEAASVEESGEASAEADTAEPDMKEAPEISLASEAPAEEPAPLPEVKVVEVPTTTMAAGSAPADPWQELQDEIARQSGMNLEQLYELLDRVPKSARPALLQAISVSENGYMKALEALLNRPR